MIKVVIMHDRAIEKRDGRGCIKDRFALPELSELFASDRDAAKRFVEFSTANILDPNIRRAMRTPAQFAASCEATIFASRWKSSRCMSRPIWKPRNVAFKRLW
jgi:hypothetical protein